jgi:hypothetical protein
VLFLAESRWHYCDNGRLSLIATSVVAERQPFPTPIRFLAIDMISVVYAHLVIKGHVVALPQWSCVTWLCKPLAEQSKFEFLLGKHNRTPKLYLE